ncbi:DUF983 domain-containing protein [Pseudaminobacter sp. 19-2017]|uniref:DUF983 domain-containing protein n=1 Tax=Pseudaminobacter soli (ex Zhang et al. 2022) TaxID=2831468 RepID=A0A942DWT8_9HYPH|nr:DUF983 domain-containing protein [Pseudaminobacter soli]MBS3648247.1 DUF983 domain-containing protein [Pseudaminobacter soli]
MSDIEEHGGCGPAEAASVAGEDKAHWPPVGPFRAGLKGRCPRCGEGKLFRGYLELAPQCGVCRLDYSFAEAGDGPAVFVILIIGFIVVGLALWMEVSLNPPLWLHLLIWIPFTLVLALTALRLIKGVLVTLQYRNKAAEGRIDRPA